MAGRGVHVDVCCPHCGGPLDLDDQWQVSIVERTGKLTCPACRREWVLNVRLALTGRAAPNRRIRHAV